MMQEFKVLWFEDNIRDFEDIIPKLEDHCKKLNRQFCYDHFDYYPPDFDVKLFEGKYSIAFIDLNLKNGQKGIEIVNILREKGTFLEVLLYSNLPQELIRMTEGENYVEGVFRHATIKDIGKKMIEVIEIVNYREIMTIERAKLSGNI
jgi:hypothetical protein